MHDSTARRLSALHRMAFQASRGVIGRRLVHNDMMLLTTIGRRSGRPHTVPLLHLMDGNDPIVVASWGGREQNPHWYLNLVANPSVEAQIRDRRFAAAARVLDEPERGLWWKRAVAAYDGYATYQSRTDRIIPLVRLQVIRDG